MCVMCLSSLQCAEGRKGDPSRGTAWLPEGSGSRHLPMVTSSSTLAGYGAIGAGIPPYEIKQVITVCKAYSSAVGAGAFVSEIFGEEADELRRRGGGGGEFGATTGRPRRMDGLTVLLPGTDAGCRELQTWRSQFWTCWDTWMRSLSA